MGDKYDQLTYGDAWELYPVQRGDVWSVGNARFMCGDAETQDWQRFSQMITTPSVVYVDPPWGPGNATSFRRKASADGKASYPELLARLSQLVKRCSGSVFIEMGLRWVSTLDHAMQGAGATLRDRWQITYYRKSPSILSRYTFRGDDGFSRDLSGQDDSRTPYLVLEQYSPGAVVLDTMCGQGLTALAAIQAGHQFWGFELHPRRMASALQKCGAASGAVPTKSPKVGAK